MKFISGTYQDMAQHKSPLPLLSLCLGIFAIFGGRALLAGFVPLPYSFQIFDTLTVIGASFVLYKDYRVLRKGDWVLALALGLAVGIGMGFATLFSPYPFLGWVKSHWAQAVLRGTFTALAGLGGLVISRQGGPVEFLATNGDWRKVSKEMLLGLAIGLPLAILNVFALQFTQGQSIHWQNPLAALVDAFQPGIVEEVLYRFALWGLIWLWLRNSQPERAVCLAGVLAMLIHNYSHFDDLFIEAPLVALGMGAILALLWGLPPLILARRRGLEAAMAFHWIQDAARFLAGF